LSFSLHSAKSRSYEAPHYAVWSDKKFPEIFACYIMISDVSMPRNLEFALGNLPRGKWALQATTQEHSIHFHAPRGF
jgi:hypothetical protein